MTKGQQVRIIGKRVNGSKIMYQLQVGAERQWFEYEELIEHLDLVIQYEKDRKARLHGTEGRRHRCGPQNIDIEGSEEEKEEQRCDSANFPRKDVKSMQFIEQKDKQLIFRVDFKDGSYRRMTNSQLKQQYPANLIDFYESNLLIDFP